MDMGTLLASLSTVLFATVTPIAYIKYVEEKERQEKAKRKRRKKRPRDIYDDLLDLEFCPGMTWLFDILYSQRRQFQRTCSRFAAVRHRVDDWRKDVIVDAVETSDKALEKNIGEILNLVVMAGYNPKMGLVQKEFDKEKINRPALRSYLNENIDILEKLDDLITVAVESSWHRVQFTAMELDAWASGFKKFHEFEEDFKEPEKDEKPKKKAKKKKPRAAA